MAKYDEAFKLAVVKEYLSGALGHRSLEDKRGISGSTVRTWARSFAEYDIDGLRKKI